MEETRRFAQRLKARPWLSAWLGWGERHEVTRFALLRLLGLVYTAAFASIVWQVVPLVGERGLTPATSHLARLLAVSDSAYDAFMSAPSLFWLTGAGDRLLLLCGWIGLGLSVAVLLGATNALLFLLLWALYRSFITVGQLWYGYGWELQLVETGFLAVFLCPLGSLKPFPMRRAPLVVLWLYRWLACRIMLGAGLIKLRGDPCWRELTCLDFHFETQPIPNPLSPLFHFLPHEVHAAGVLFNHLCELILPLCLFGPRSLRLVSAGCMILFQGILILSGNLSFLNWLTIVPLVGCLDDRALARLLPRRRVARVGRRQRATRTQGGMAAVLAAVVAWLSIAPVRNLLSPDQRMNAAFDPWMLVNTYGAFGGVGRRRPELIFEGTRDERPGPDTRWRPYEFPCKPGDPTRQPCVISPLQPRLEWQLWFAAMGHARDRPWVLRLLWQLLHAEPGVRSLLAHDPFGDRPPRYVRVLRYRYRFAPLSADAVWAREFDGHYLPPLSPDALRPAMIELGYVRQGP